jgi:hypothetical protein
MPYTARVRASLARHLLAEPSQDLRRRIAVLRQTPFPPGSRALTTDDEWHDLDESFSTHRAFIYGTNDNALVFTYDGKTQTLSIELAIVDGCLVGRR